MSDRPASHIRWLTEPLEVVLVVVGMALLAAVAIPPRAVDFSGGSGRSPVSRVSMDMRSLGTALEAYYVDQNVYPASARGHLGVNQEAPEDSAVFNVPTFRQFRKDQGPHTLTSPVAYITGYPRDLFSDYRDAVFGYYGDWYGWILFSPGPDGAYDIDPERDYDARVTQPTPALLLKAYDASNGTFSGGDIFRVKQ